MGLTVTVFGLGFVGLTTALGFADKGNKVLGIDVDQERIAILSKAKIPFAEPGLDEVLKRQLNKNFFIADNPLDAVRQSDFVYLCVGTPCGDNGQADLKYIYSALDMFSDVLEDGKFRVIVIKSTVPPGTTLEKVIPYLKKKGRIPGKKFGVANNPEFLREGRCWEDFSSPDRIVCGVCDDKSAEMLRKLYEVFSAPLFTVSLNTGEFIKYLSNTMLATMISYANEMSKVAAAIGNIETKQAFRVLHMDRRWGGCNMKSYVYPGCGFGGYCLPKDTQAMVAAATAKGFEPDILKNVIATNQSMPNFMVEKIKKVAVPGQKIGILGLSFKPNSDDVRDSASAKIIRLLKEQGYLHILGYDPIANEEFKHKYQMLNLEFCDNLEDICGKADVLVIATAWQEFAELDKKYASKKIVDCRYFL